MEGSLVYHPMPRTKPGLEKVFHLSINGDNAIKFS